MIGYLQGLVHSFIGRGQKPFILPIRFTTDGSGDPTLSNNFGDAIKITKSGNSYVISLGAISKVNAVHVQGGAGTAQALFSTPTFDVQAGTVTIPFAAANNSSTFNVVIYGNG